MARKDQSGLVLMRKSEIPVVCAVVIAVLSRYYQHQHHSHRLSQINMLNKPGTIDINGLFYNHVTSYKNADCMKTCMAWNEDYSQRFCANEFLKVWCYPQDTLRITKTIYGNLPCRPSDEEYTETPTCKAPSLFTLRHVKRHCQYKNKCKGKVNAHLMSGGRERFYGDCKHSKQSNFYIEYKCKPTIQRCVEYCECKKSQPEEICIKKNRDKQNKQV